MTPPWRQDFPGFIPMTMNILWYSDAAAMSPPDYPILVVNLNKGEETRPFRAVPGEIAAIEVNLSLANMDYFEFAENADADGVFRGFR
jgi:hypothetical protein